MNTSKTHRDMLIDDLNMSLIKKVQASQRIQAAIRGYWTRLSLKLFILCKEKQYFKVKN